jgi:RNA polymerase sigma factor (sigma-70 family)
LHIGHNESINPILDVQRYVAQDRFRDVRDNTAARPLEKVRMATHHHELEALLSRIGGQLRRLVGKHLPRSLGISADEVEQDVRVRIWRALEQEKTLFSASSYLYRTVMSVIVDHVRKRRDEPMEAHYEQFVTHDSSDIEAQRAEHRRALLESVAQLAERRRLPVQLYLQEFSIAQIAEVVGESEPSVRNLVYRGLADLRELLLARGVSYE